MYIAAEELILVIFKRHFDFLSTPIFDDFSFSAVVEGESLNAVYVARVKDFIHNLLYVFPAKCYANENILIPLDDGTVRAMDCDEWKRAQMLMCILIKSEICITDCPRDKDWVQKMKRVNLKK
jgi:hypothetical protein